MLIYKRFFQRTRIWGFFEELSGFPIGGKLKNPERFPEELIVLSVRNIS